VVAIRAARDEDEAGLIELDAATWSAASSPGPQPEPGQPFLERYGAANVTVAVDGEAVVGFLILGPWLPLPAAAHVLEIRGLAVVPARQGEGIGTALLDRAIERARGEGRRRLVLRVLSTNPDARRLYERRGFQVELTFREAFLIDGAYVDDLTMALDLAAGTDR
jgi:ribosomal protein S18 acetylase RimI-like enzyme